MKLKFLQARFSNAGAYGIDDAGLTTRGCALKMRISDDVELDMVLHSHDRFSPFENSVSFAALVASNGQLELGGTTGTESYKNYLYKRPCLWHCIVATTCSPSSYTVAHYLSKYSILLTEEDSEKEYYCKFRIVPFDKETPLELMSEARQAQPWHRLREENDARPKDYLQGDLKEKMSDGKIVQFRLEVMTRPKIEGKLEWPIVHPHSDWTLHGCAWKSLAILNFSHTVDDPNDWWSSGIGGWGANPGIVPDGLSIITPRSRVDPNWINWARVEMYKENSNIRNIRRFAMSEEEVHEFNYHVDVKTGHCKDAGTDDNISIIIVGDKAATKKQILDHSFFNDFERDSLVTYSFKDRDIGNIEYIIIDKDPKALSWRSDWYLDRITVTKEGWGLSVDFPYFGLIKDNIPDPLIIATNATSLPQKETKVRTSARIIEISFKFQIKTTKFEWSYECGRGNGTTVDCSEFLPGFLEVKSEDKKYEALDPCFKWSCERYDIYSTLRRMLKKKGYWNKFQELLGLESPASSIEDFIEVANEIERPSQEKNWINDWDSDIELGRQVMNGPYPIYIYRVRELPEHFPVTDDHVQGLLLRGLTLEEELSAGNMYMIDFKILEGVSTGTYLGKRLALGSPMALFYVRPDEKLVPIAIQLGQEPGEQFPIWTPNDKREDWLLAKIWFRNAEAQCGQLEAHLAQTHFLLDPFALAMSRQLSAAHPIFKLLKESFKNLIAIDTRAREFLISLGGSADSSMTTGFGSEGILETLRKAYEAYSYQQMNYQNNLLERDVMDLPGYHHRDDALKLWTAVSDYIADMVNTFYLDDGDVLKDWELQNWVADVFHNGFGKMKNMKHPSLGVPSKLTTKSDLIDYLCNIYYTTVRHNAVNFYAFE